MKRTIFVLTALLSSASASLAHQGHHHEHPDTELTAPMIYRDDSSIIVVIRENYKRRIETIFNKSCMDCHSAQTQYPWYYKIPGIKQMLDSDINEARHHLDFSDSYPFKSHATPVEDLDAIAESAQNGTMPPFSYRMMHSKAKLTEEEKKTILKWAKQSKALLEKKSIR